YDEREVDVVVVGDEAAVADQPEQGPRVRERGQPARLELLDQRRGVAPRRSVVQPAQRRSVPMGADRVAAQDLLALAPERLEQVVGATRVLAPAHPGQLPVDLARPL